VSKRLREHEETVLCYAKVNHSIYVLISLCIVL